MSKEYIVNEGGIIHTAFIDTNSEDFNKLKEIILEHSKKQTPNQKLENEFLSLKFQVESYLETNNPKNIISVGDFLKKLIRLYKIRNKALATYIGLSESNLSAVISGRRTINNDLALKLGNIFKIRPDIWLNLQNKNNLLTLNKISGKEYKKYKLEDLVSLK